MNITNIANFNSTYLLDGFKELSGKLFEISYSFFKEKIETLFFEPIQSLREACEHGDLERVRQLIEKNQIKRKHLSNMLFVAAQTFNLPILELLLQKGADPNFRRGGFTPLSWFIQHNFRNFQSEMKEIVLALVNGGADLFLIDNLYVQFNYKIIQLLTHNDFPEISFHREIIAFVEKNPHHEKIEEARHSSMQESFQNRDFAQIHLLAALKRINEQDINEETFLHYILNDPSFAIEDQYKLTKAFLPYGADGSIPNIDGVTPEDIARNLDPKLDFLPRPAG